MGNSTQVSHGLVTPAGVTWLGLVVNVLLSIGKVFAGFIFSSQAILADGFHSASDLITDLAVLLGLRAANKPADDNHHYGHDRITSLVALFVGAALLLAALWIALEAISTLRAADRQVRSLIPLLMAVLSIVLKEVLFRLTRLVGRQCHDLSLVANAWHHRSDAFSSMAAALGLAGVYFGGPDWAFLDHLTAVVLAAFLGAAALKIIWMSAAELLDRAPDQETQRTIARIVSNTRGVRDFHAFRARKIGGKVVMDIHVLVDPHLTVHEGHEIATMVENRLKESEKNVVEAVVHIEPWEDRNSGRSTAVNGVKEESRS
jgi:cation diffusion facilitator family transporter